MPNISTVISLWPDEAYLLDGATGTGGLVSYAVRYDTDEPYDVSSWPGLVYPGGGGFVPDGYVKTVYKNKAINFSPISIFNYLDISGEEENRITNQIKNVSNLNFQRVLSGESEIDLRFILTGGLFYGATLKFTQISEIEYSGEKFADIWINYPIVLDLDDNQKVNLLNHEFLHALGLSSHSGEIYSLAQEDTYNRSTLGLYDVFGLQKLYGANFDHKNGNTSYGSDLIESSEYVTIWDGGGVDEIDASSFGESIIDLRQGEFSSIGGFLSSFWDPDQNVAVAWGAVIENARGSNNSDLIIGNRVANTIHGGDGDDAIYGDGASYAAHGGKGRAHLSDIGLSINVGDKGTGDDWYYSDEDQNGAAPISDDDNDEIFGGEGDDLIFAGAGDDEVDGGEDEDEIHGGAGKDIILGGDNDDSIYGDEGEDNLYGEGGDDVLYGGADNDELFGDSEDDELYGEAGEDKLWGGTENDKLYGGSENDELYGEDGEDELHGDAGDDRLEGGAKNDKLFGGDDNDTLKGDGENDELHGNAGKDKLYGGTGSDELDGGSENDDLYGDDDEGESDRLRGGSGADRFYAGSGDIILDAEKADRIYLNKRKLTGGTKEVDEEDVGGAIEPGAYENDDGTIYNYSGSSITVTNGDASVTIENWKNGNGGIRLREDHTSEDQNEAEDQASPLVIDLDGDGLELTQLTSSNTYFDLDLDGFAERTSWVGADDGLLAVDRNNDGIINDVSELFGSDPLLRPVDGSSSARSGFSALADYDSNDDNQITVLDANFADLVVWRDANGDGETDEGELHSLASLGIESISLAYTRVDKTAGANHILDRGRLQMADGGYREISDVYFSIDQFDSVELDTNDVEVTAEIGALPFLIGSGELSDLDVAMARDPLLREMVEQLSSLSASELHEFTPRVRDIVLRWTGADRAEYDSRGIYVNGQWLKAVEVINGRAFSQQGSSDPRQNAGAIAAGAFEDFVASTAAKLFGQLSVGQLVLPELSFQAGAFFNAEDGTIVADLLEAADLYSPTETGKAIAYWNTILTVLTSFAAALGTDSADIELAADDYLSGRYLGLSARQLRRSATMDNAIPAHIGLGGWKDDLPNNVYNIIGNAVDIYDAGGGDTYIVSSPNSSLKIADTGGSDRLVFAKSLRSDIDFDFSVVEGRIDLTVSDSVRGIEVRIENQFQPQKKLSAIETFVFADGESVNWRDLIATDQIATVDADILIAASDGSILNGLEGDDVLVGGVGSDTFQFGPASGSDGIIDLGADGISIDTVQISALLSDVSFQASSDPERRDLKIILNATGETLTIANQNVGTALAIENFEFSGGQTLTAQQVDDILNTGTSGADDLRGTVREDRIEGLAGNDRLRGGSGHDTYAFNNGSGHDVIEDTFQNDIRFGPGIELADLEFEMVGANFSDLLIRYNGGADSILVRNQLSSGAIQNFHFDDDPTVEWADIRQTLEGLGGDIYRGTLWNDELTAEIDQSIDDVLDGGQGSDTLSGGLGSDAYRFGWGYGIDTVFDVGPDIDTIELGEGITLSDLNLSRQLYSNDLFISVGTAGEMIIVSGHFNSGFENQVERLKFSDGSIIQVSDLTDVTTGASGSDILQSLSNPNANVVFSPGAGNDTIYGTEGNNRILLDAGFGTDSVTDPDGNDTIEFGSGFNVIDLQFTRLADDLVIAFAGSSDQLIWRNHFLRTSSSDSFGVDTLKFFDGTVIQTSALNDMIADATGGVETSGDDMITNHVVLDGGAGNDILQPGSRTEEIVFGTGYGHDTITASQFNPPITLTIRLSGLDFEDVTISRSVVDPRDIVIAIVSTGETLTIERVESGSSLRTPVDFIEFDDDVRFSIYQIVDLVVASDGTPGGEELFAVEGLGTLLDPGAGNDRIIVGKAGSTVVFGPGRGHDVIVPTDFFSVNTKLQIEVWAWDQLIIEPVLDGSTTHIRILGPDGSTLLIENAGARVWGPGEGGNEYHYNVFEIHTVADGLYYSGEDLYNAAFLARSGGTGDDIITGTELDDDLQAGPGNDLILTGLAETSDTIHFGRGDGHDLIVAERHQIEDIEARRHIQIILEDDIEVSDVEFRIDDDGAISILLDGGVDSLKIDAGNWLTHPTFKLLSVGTLTLESGRVFTGQAIQDYLNPEEIETVMMNGVEISGAQFWDWYTNNDPYAGGIEDPDASALGITELALVGGRVLTGQSVDDFLFPGPLVSASMSDDSVLNAQEFDMWLGVQPNVDDPLTVRFGDDTVVSLADIVRVHAVGTVGDDVIFAPLGGKITPGAGNDVVIANAGAIISFGPGSGKDTVRQMPKALPEMMGGFDTRNPIIVDIFGAVSQEELVLARGAENPDDLIIKIIGSEDQLTLESFFKYAGLTTGDVAYLDEDIIKFSDSSVMSLKDIMGALSGNDLSGNNTITSDDSGGTLDGAGGNDTLLGGAGSDLYVFERAYAEDAVRDAGGENDTIRFGANITFSDLVFTRTGPQGEDLLIEVDGVERLTLTIDGQFGPGSGRIESFTFEDGSRYNWFDVQKAILAAQATLNADAISGFSTDDVIDGRAGNDTISPLSGDDVVYGGAGRDRVVLSGTQSEYTITYLSDRVVISDTVLGRDGVDTLFNVEDVYFTAGNNILNLVPENSLPTATAFNVSGVEDATLVITAADILLNTADADGTPLKVVSVRNAVSGQVWLNIAGNAVFKPNADFTGNATFEYVVRDPDGAEGVETVTVSVSGTNDAPIVAVPLLDQTSLEDTAVDVSISGDTFDDIDGDNLTLTAQLIGGDPLPIWLSFVDGHLTGTPPSDFFGSYDIEIVASDGVASISDVFRLDILPVNEIPTAADGTYNALAGVSFEGEIVANDADGDTIYYIVDVPSTYGAFSIDLDTGSFVYRPYLTSTGIDYVSVSIVDSVGNEHIVELEFDIGPALLSLDENEVIEGAANSSLVGDVSASIEPGTTLTYRLIDDAGGRFDIDEDTGEIFVANGTLLDYETDTTHDITVGASDGTHEITSLFTLNVENDESDDEEGEVNDPGDTESVNVITGTSAAETLTGTAGRDQISGLGDNDTLEGLGGNDVLDGGSGDDILYGGAGNDILKAGVGDDQLFGGDGIDTVDYSDQNPQNSQVHTFYLSHSQFNIGMGAGDTYDSIENIRGSAKADYIYATSGANIIEGRSYNDVLWGGAGNDIYVYNANNNHDTIQEGDFSVDGVGAVSLTGLDGGVDVIAFAEQVDLGELNPTWDSDDLVFRPDGGNVRVKNQKTEATQAIEYVQLADGLRVSLSSARFYGMTNYTTGTSADDLIVGTSNNNTLYGHAGNDALGGAQGNDTLYGGDGDDHLEGGSGSDTIDGGASNVRGPGDTDRSIQFGDTARYTISNAAVSIDLLAGTATGGHATGDTLVSIENLVGSHGYGDTLKGDTGENWLKGLGGDDALDGYSGDDVLDGGDGNDTLIGGDGADILYGGSGDDELDGGNGHDIALFAGLKSSYTVTTVGGTIQINDDNAYADGDDGTDTLIGIETAQFKGGATLSLASPVVLDLDGNGVNLVSKSQSKAKFDLDGDGIRDTTGWVSKGDGILVFDRNGDGKLSGVNEISFIDDKPGAKSDLDGLTAFDTNGDGRLDKRDAQFSSFKVWRDKDGDGKVDKKELMTLKKAGVAAIELSGTALEKEWGWDDNIVVNTGSFIRTNGRRQSLADVALNFDGSRGDVEGFADIGSGRSNIGYAPLSEIENWTRGETDTAFAAGASAGGGMRDRQVEALVTAMASFGAANFDAVSLSQNIAALRRDVFAGGGFARLF